MEIRNLYPGAMASNCYLLTVGKAAAVVDPSAPVADILSALREANATLSVILLTHGHFDHLFSLEALRKATGAPVLIHEKEADFPDDPQKNMFERFFGMPRRFGAPDRGVKSGEEITLADEKIRVIHTPGHTAGSVCYLCNGEFLLTGDTLFADSYGRTDLYSGDEEALFDSLNRLRELPSDLRIYPGHGEPAVLGQALDCVLY